MLSKLCASLMYSSKTTIALRGLLMNELTQRLSSDQPIIMGGAQPSVEELRKRVQEMGYVLIKFTETRGGTELGFELERRSRPLHRRPRPGDVEGDRPPGAYRRIRGDRRLRQQVVGPFGDASI